MSKLLKVTVSLTLVVLFLIACVISLVLLFFSAWLHTYTALTRETVVAEVVMHPIQKDDKGEYIQIEFTPFSHQSALTTTVNPNVAPTDAVGTTQTYKLYGDTVNIGGPVVKFHNELILVNFETIYKMARIQGVYNANLDKERNRTVFSTIDLNGGFDQTWWTLNDNEGVWPYNMFVDRVVFSISGEPGFKAGDSKKYQIIVTNEGFTWNFVERITK